MINTDTIWLIIIISLVSFIIYSLFATGLIYNIWVQLSISIFLVNTSLEGIKEIRLVNTTKSEN